LGPTLSPTAVQITEPLSSNHKSLNILIPSRILQYHLPLSTALSTTYAHGTVLTDSTSSLFFFLFQRMLSIFLFVHISLERKAEKYHLTPFCFL
jgi:hypothetical protein